MRSIVAIQTHLQRLRGRQPLVATVSLAAALLVVGPALAEGKNKNPDGIPSPSIATSLPANGDPTGMRRWFATRGITYGLSYTSEVLGNPSGGVRRGRLYEGKFEGFVAADLEKYSSVGMD